MASWSYERLCVAWVAPGVVTPRTTLSPYPWSPQSGFCPAGLSGWACRSPSWPLPGDTSRPEVSLGLLSCVRVAIPGDTVKASPGTNLVALGGPELGQGGHVSLRPWC